MAGKVTAVSGTSVTIGGPPTGPRPAGSLALTGALRKRPPAAYSLPSPRVARSCATQAVITA